MELRHLNYFVAVAEELSFSRAADRLHIAQPSLSQQIRNLERELGVTLFRRTKRRVELSAPGEALLNEARDILHRAEQARELVRRVASGQVGRLTIGFVGSAIYDVLPALLRAFEERHPDVQVVLASPALTTFQIAALESGQTDLALLRPPVRSRKLRTLTVRREVFLVALPEHHRLAHRSQVSMHDLAGEAFVTLPVRLESVLLAETIALCQRWGFRPRVRQEATDLDTVLRLVAAGMGVALVPSSVAEARIRALVLRPLRERSPSLETCLAWRAADESATVQAFITLAQEIFPCPTGRWSGRSAEPAKVGLQPVDLLGS